MTLKKRIFQILFISLSIAATYWFVPWSIVKLWLSPLPDSIEEQMQAALQYDLDGIILYIDEGGKAPRQFAAGWKNRAEKIPAKPTDLFKIASISKLYIAVATTKLVAQNKLSLETSLASLLPDLKNRIANSDKITLRMLLTHRSGIPNFTDEPDFPWDKPFKDNRQTLALVLDKEADFEPDTDYAYSNTNYLLIGEILDKTLGYAHHLYIKNEILAPLQLHHTFSLLTEIDPDLLMSGYYQTYEPDIKMNDFIAPGGSMIATAADVGVFLRALIVGKLLTETEQSIYSSVYEYEHTGLLPGYSSIAKYDKATDTIMIQFVNTSGGVSWTITEMIYKRLLQILKTEG